ncbi:MAG: UvrD-helicase domain-containing protein, partial [Synergistaceae bacterium]|nr:UvrD-helicase domain-containing protein [Synergistaceae bacterium]
MSRGRVEYTLEDVITVTRTANQAQQAAIDARMGLITVSAGAGTGKTWTLASRYASLLTDRKHGCNVENIITLTFTEKAAQEMKERIESVIREKINSADEKERFVLHGALSHFDDAYILTIHSFASRILRESALKLGLDPASSIISQSQADELTEELGRKIEELDEAITKPFKDIAMLEEILSKWQPYDIAVLSKECEEIHSAHGRSYKELLQLCNNSAMKKVIEKVKANSMPRIKSAYEKWSYILNEIKEQIFSGKKDKIPEYVLNFRAFYEKWGWKEINSSDELIIFFVELMEYPLKRASFGAASETINLCLGESASEWKKKHKDLLMICKNLSMDEILANYFEDLREREALIKLCSVCWSLMENKRRGNKILTFTDLIKYGSEGIARDPKRNFKQIMVDEFQDTDPLQESMIRSIAKEPDVNIFVVGDPKQSIYRFRNADLSIFERYVKASKKRKGNGTYIKMNISFRMRSGLYRKINGLFRHVWPDNLGVTIKNLKYENLSGETNNERDSGTLPIMTMLTEKQDRITERVAQGGDSYSVLLNGSASTSSNRKETISVVRKRLLNKLIETLIHWKTGELTIWDQNEKCLRPFEWGDCALLTQTRASWILIEEAFAKAG